MCSLHTSRRRLLSSLKVITDVYFDHFQQLPWISSLMAAPYCTKQYSLLVLGVLLLFRNYLHFSRRKWAELGSVHHGVTAGSVTCERWEASLVLWLKEEWILARVWLEEGEGQWELYTSTFTGHKLSLLCAQWIFTVTQKKDWSLLGHVKHLPRLLNLYQDISSSNRDLNLVMLICTNKQCGHSRSHES